MSSADEDYEFDCTTVAKDVTAPQPMDPEWLDRMRRGLDSRDCAVEALIADRDYYVQRVADLTAKAESHRGDYLRAHRLLCDLYRRLRRALLPDVRSPDWDAICIAAEKQKP